MSVATTTPYIKLANSSTPCCSSCSSSTSPSTVRFSSLRNKCSSASYSLFTIRSSQTEGPLGRPVSPPVREPSSSSPQPPTPPSIKPPSPPSSSPPPPHKPVAVAVEDQAKGAVTLEFQRQKAKELQEYFKLKKLEEADQGPVFGFIGKNEINNGRWAMFGFAVGMITEYATGSDFVYQIKILLSNVGIVDLE